MSATCLCRSVVVSVIIFLSASFCLYYDGNIMILSLVSKSDTWSIFFSTRCRTSDKNKIDQVSDLAVFFDQRSYSTSCHVRRKGFRREVVHRFDEQ